MELKNRTVRELEELIKKAEEEILFKKGAHRFLEWYYVPVDDRSCGTVKFKIETEYGTLKANVQFGNGYIDQINATRTVDGEEKSDDIFYCDSFYENTSENDAKLLIIEAVDNWVLAWDEISEQDSTD